MSTATDPNRKPPTDYKISVGNYLSHDNQRYRTTLYKLALTNSAAYFDMRERVLADVKYNAVSTLYDTFFNVMTSGTAADGVTSVISIDALGAAIAPSIPYHKVNEFCLSASSTLDEIINELVEMLLPLDIQSILAKKMIIAGNVEAPAPAGI